VIGAGTAHEGLLDRGLLQSGDLLLDCVGGQTKSQAVGAVHDGGRAISVMPPFGHLQLERGITGESFAATGGRLRLEALSRLVNAGQLRPQVEAVLPRSYRWTRPARRLRRVASRHKRGKVVLQIGH
jgi:NADPH:quinone reductase